MVCVSYRLNLKMSCMSQHFLKGYTLKGEIHNSKHCRTLGQHVRSRLLMVHAGHGSGLDSVGKVFSLYVLWLVPLPTAQRTLLRHVRLFPYSNNLAIPWTCLKMGAIAVTLHKPGERRGVQSLLTAHRAPRTQAPPSTPTRGGAHSNHAYLH